MQWKEVCSGSWKERMSLWEFRGNEDRWLWIDTEFEAWILLQIPTGYGKQEDQLVLKGAAKVFLQRMSVRLSGLSLCPSIMKCWHLTGSHCPSCNIWCLDSSLANIIACWPTTTRQRGKKGDHPERRKTPLWDQQNWCTSLGNSKEEAL